MRKRIIVNLMIIVSLGAAWYATFHFDFIAKNLYKYTSFFPAKSLWFIEGIPLYVMSAVVNMFNGATGKDKLINFVITTIFAYCVAMGILFIKFFNTMYYFD